eukprot:IDg5333t1
MGAAVLYSTTTRAPVLIMAARANARNGRPIAPYSYYFWLRFAVSIAHCRSRTSGAAHWCSERCRAVESRKARAVQCVKAVSHASGLCGAQVFVSLRAQRAPCALASTAL